MKNSTSSLPLIKKAFGLSLSNIWRNKFLSLATIFVMGTTLFIFNVILGVNFIAQNALNDLNQKVDLVVYLKESTTFADSQSIQQDLMQLDGVMNVTYTSKEDALELIKTTHPDLTLAFEKYQLGNPLPASLNIVTEHPQYHEPVSNFLAQDKYQTFLSSISNEDSSTNSGILNSVSENLLKVTDFANQIIFWLILIFVIGGALIILNAIQITIYSRKKEINIMKMVGAPYWFIRLPFIFESIIYGLMGLVVNYIMLTILAQNIEMFNGNFLPILLAEILATLILSIASSFLAVHEHLHRKIHES